MPLFRLLTPIAAAVVLASGCGSSELPNLPEAQSGEPHEVQWVGLFDLDGAKLDAQSLVAGSVAKAVWQP